MFRRRTRRAFRKHRGPGGLNGKHVFRHFVEQLAHARRGADRFLDLAVEIGKRRDRAADIDCVENEARQIAKGDDAGLQELRASPHHEYDRPKMAKMMKATSAAR